MTRRAARALVVVTAGATAWFASSGTGAADNCRNPRDCYATDTAATRAGLGLLALLLLWLLLELLGRGGEGAGGWGWLGGAGETGEGAGDGAGGPGAASAGSLTDRLLGLLTGSYGFGESGASLGLEQQLLQLGGRLGGTGTLAGDVGAAHGTLGVTGEGIAEALLKAGATLDSSGLTAQAKLEATLGARAELVGTLQAGWLSQTLKGEAFAGATGTATGKIQVGSEGVDIGGSVDAFLGGKLTGEYDLGAGPVTGKATGSVSYGLGYKGGFDWKISSDGIGFDAKGGGTLGIGAEGEVSIEVNPQQVLTGIGNAVDYLASIF